MQLPDLSTLLQARYGQETSLPPIDDTTADAVLQLLLSHRSVRHFRNEPLPEGTLERLVAAGQSAASSSNLQAWSVVALEDSPHKAEAALLCADQDFIRQAPLFLVFCADLSRLTAAAASSSLTDAGLEYVEMFLIAVIDAALAAQNVAVAAESLGLGICYVGAARNRPRELAKLLKLPRRVFALFGMAIGWPEASDSPAASIKPRLPLNEVLYREVYTTAEREENLNHYDAIMQAFYARQNMAQERLWSEHSARRIATAAALRGRDTLRETLQEDRGFELR